MTASIENHSAPDDQAAGTAGMKSSLEVLLGFPTLVDRVRADVTGAGTTTFAIGGPFEAFLEISDERELASLLARLHEQKLPYRILGAGSNLLVSSRGVNGLTIRLGRGFRTLLPKGEGKWRVGAAYSLMTLTRELSDQGFAGLEFAGGIPASMGGAVVMNAGAHGGELAGVLERIVLVLPDGHIEEWKAADLQFSYRHSALPAGAVVVAADIRLVPGDKGKIVSRRKEYLAERKSRQPLQSPSAGSVFRNPSPTTPAGMLIERVGLKGCVIGGARVSPLHANWIVNESRTATDGDVRALIERCQVEVREQLGIELVPEIVQWL